MTRYHPDDLNAQERYELRHPNRTKARSKSSGPSGKHKTLFDNAQFIAIDGEGWRLGKETTLTIKSGSKNVPDTEYKSWQHFYTMLAASNGKEFHREIRSFEGKRLGTRECLDFLCDVARETAPSILVIFAGGYDVNHMLMFGLPQDALRQLGQGRRCDFRYDGGRVQFTIEYRPRKSLQIKRVTILRAGEKPQTDSCTLWDVWGFFQSSFVTAMEKWLGKDYPHYASIKRMKEQRSEFLPDQVEEISAYNLTELISLCAIMDKVRSSIGMLGLKISRWDGAGAVAAAMYKEHGIKEAKTECPSAVYDAACHAYSGGHIEVFQIGHYEGPVYHYDINSAYPTAIATLPDLTAGNWKQLPDLSGHISEFSVVRVRFSFSAGNSFYPLFYRTEDKTILYPSDGEGWYWLPEIRAAQEYVASFGGTLEFLDGWAFHPTDNARKPFAFVPDYYKTRQHYCRPNKPLEDEWQDGGEKIIKLGLNSLYGKMAQQIGGKDGEAPPYFQIEWAGFVTSYTRAKLMFAACQAMPSIISLATDGIFSTTPLDLDTPREKRLGAWEFKQEHGITVVAAGVYWLHQDGGKKPVHYSRGFAKEAMQEYQPVLEDWHKRRHACAVVVRRLIGIGTACSSAALYKVRGRFLQGSRMLSLRGDSAKRFAIPDRAKPHKGLVPTRPKPSNYAAMGEISAIYPISWLNDENDDETEFPISEYMEDLDFTEA